VVGLTQSFNNMKTIEEYIKEGNEGYSLTDVIDNLTTDQIVEAIKEHSEKQQENDVQLTINLNDEWDRGYSQGGEDMKANYELNG